MLAAQEELARQQRYYEVCGGGFVGRASTASAASVGGQWAVQKRSIPTVTLLSSTPQLLEYGIAARNGSGSAIGATGGLTTAGAAELVLNGFSGMSGNVVGLTGDVFGVSADL